METKVYRVKVQFGFSIDATSKEAAREMAIDQLGEWLENIDSIALESAARDAEIEESNEN